MNDFLGSEINPGDKVITAQRRGSSLDLSKGIVVATVQKETGTAVRVIRLEGDERLVQGTRELGEFMVVMGSVPVIELDLLREAYAAQLDANRKWHSGELQYPEVRDTEKVAVRAFSEVWGD